MGISAWQIILVIVLVMLLFGRGKISGLMGDVAKGITSFKKGLKDESEGSNEAATPQPVIEADRSEPVQSAPEPVVAPTPAPAPEPVVAPAAAPVAGEAVVDGEEDEKPGD